MHSKAILIQTAVSTSIRAKKSASVTSSTQNISEAETVVCQQGHNVRTLHGIFDASLAALSPLFRAYCTSRAWAFQYKAVKKKLIAIDMGA